MVLAAASVAVLAMGVYLFVQVRSTPAQASATAVTHPTPAPTPPRARVGDSVPRTVTHERKPEVTRARPAITTPQRTPDPGLDPVEPSEADRHVDIKKDATMDQANKAYDRQDFDEAMAIATKVLAKDPTNVRMLRIVVSASCIQGDPAIAQGAFEKLPKADQAQMKVRCDRYGVTLKDS